MPTTTSQSTYLRPHRYVIEGRARMRARNLALTAGARLQRAAARAGGDEGLALARALTDMMLGGVAPAGWPIQSMIELLSRATAGPDRQVQRLVSTLHQIAADIHMLDPADDVCAPDAAIEPPCAA